MPDTPVIYDINEDRTRPATQADIDELVLVKRAYGKLRAFMQNLQDELARQVKNG